ncbi:MAG: methyltransferase domain-containing protein [Candidatus Aminicenantes bacterium]|nr:methyltransferase domain-containing protein [Candidatus Aminicenantes bacterium]
MKKLKLDSEVLSGKIRIEEKTILDIGCGLGNLVRWMISKGGTAVGLDMPEMLAKVIRTDSESNGRYVAGFAQNLPFKKCCMDAVVYFASLHHIPKTEILNALKECHRVLKAKGRALIIEPVGRKGSYFEVVRLVEDEREIHRFAYSVIKSANRIGLKMIEEEFVFFERKYQDYQKLIATFVEDRDEAKKVLSEAKEVYSRFAADRGVARRDFSFRSICRINVLEKRGYKSI